MTKKAMMVAGFLLSLVGVMPALAADPAQPRAAAKAANAKAKEQPSPNDATPEPPYDLHAAGLVSRYGTIKHVAPVGIGGLTAWTVEKGGRRFVFYTTADAQALFMGVVWDATTGRNLSDQFAPASARSVMQTFMPPAAVPQAIQQPVPQADIPPVAAFDGDYKGAISESMKTVNSLAGVTEGKGGIADTLYIIIDPRCPYCRLAYNNTREYVKKGRTIKWIPAVALGNSATGLPLAATILQSKDKTVLERVLGRHEQIATQPTSATEEALRNNLAFLFAAFEANGGQAAGVPVAFFIDRRTGSPRMMTGVSERVVLEDIFGKR